MHYFGWHSEILPDFNTCVEQEVGSNKGMIYDQYMVVWFIFRVYMFPMHLREMSTYDMCC
jgi:hypothetical protein